MSFLCLWVGSRSVLNSRCFLYAVIGIVKSPTGATKCLARLLLLMLVSKAAMTATFHYDSCSQAREACEPTCLKCLPNCVYTCVTWGKSYYCQGNAKNLYKCTANCPQGQTVNLTTGICEPKSYCPPPLSFNTDGSQCQARCGSGQQWDAVRKRCVGPDVADSCDSRSRNPIDFSLGKKYHRERVITLPGLFPITLTYHYNNQGNAEKTHQGIVASKSMNTSVAATITSLSYEEYNQQYAGANLRTDMAMGLAPSYGNATRYWRHNYEESLLPEADGSYTWYRSDGSDVVFNAAGVSVVYTTMQLRPLSTGEVSTFGYAGPLIETGSNKPNKAFDDLGRLRRVINTNGVYHKLIYNGNSADITRIEHSLRGSLEFTYKRYQVRSIHELDRVVSNYPIRLTDHGGRTAELLWGVDKLYIGNSRTHRLLTKVTYPYIGSAVSRREFEYNDAVWPMAITDIYDTDIGARKRVLYAQFRYDSAGRAIYSGRADGVEGITVDYPDALTRRVTNSLNKVATYRFADINGVRRLQSVTGEPTATCVQSDTVYEYDAAGNIRRMNRDGQITQYLHNSRGLETSRTEAAGTLEARTIITEWHAEFALPVTVTTPESITRFTYDAAGRLLDQVVTSPSGP